MKLKSTKYFSVLFIVLMLLPVSSFAYKKIKTFVLHPPEQTLEGVKRIAVLDFTETGSKEEEGNNLNREDLAIKIISDVIFGDKSNPSTLQHGKNFTDYLIGKLIESDRGIEKVQTGFLGMGSGREGKTLQDGAFTNVYEIVERAQLERLLEEQKLGMSGIVNQDQVAQLGVMLGVQAFVTGNLSITQKDTDYKETRTKKKDGKEVKEQVACQKREIVVKVRTRIISTETGKILGSTEASEKLAKSSCNDSWGTIPSADEMIDECLKKNSETIANYFAPYFELVSFEFKKIEMDKFKDIGDKAAEEAEDLHVDKAYTIYKAVYDKNPYNPEVTYNLGVLQEVVGNFTKAHELYQMAYQLNDDGRYKDALKRMDKNVEFATALANMGIEIKEHDFNTSQAAAKRALAKKIRTNGNRNDMINIHLKPTVQSAVIQRVPGGLTFIVLDRTGDWFLIELLGGKQGYVNQDACKLQD